MQYSTPVKIDIKPDLNNHVDEYWSWMLHFKTNWMMNMKIRNVGDFEQGKAFLNFNENGQNVSLFDNMLICATCIFKIISRIDLLLKKLDNLVRRMTPKKKRLLFNRHLHTSKRVWKC